MMSNVAHEGLFVWHIKELFFVLTSVPLGETSVSQSQKLLQLREMFPNKKPAKLQKLLEDNNNDVAQVADLLMD